MTDLLSREINAAPEQDAINVGGSDAFIKGMLDRIFGFVPDFDRDGNPIDGSEDSAVGLADILDPNNYNPMSLGSASIERQLITTAATGLTVIYENVTDSGEALEAFVDLLDPYRHLAPADPDPTVTLTDGDIKDEVNKRLNDADTLGDFPVVAEPNSNNPIRLTEGTDFNLLDANRDTESLFGFDDPFAPEGEEDSLVGIYIQAASVDGNIAVRLTKSNGDIVLLDDSDSLSETDPSH